MLHQKLDKKAAKTLAIELFKEVQLPTPERIFNTYPHQISGGQKQRVMIAMAMSCQPSVLFADEPTGCLDEETSEKVMNLLLDCCRTKNTACIVVSHDTSFKHIFDTHYVLTKHELIKQK